MGKETLPPQAAIEIWKQADIDERLSLYEGFLLTQPEKAFSLMAFKFYCHRRGFHVKVIPRT